MAYRIESIANLELKAKQQNEKLDKEIAKSGGLEKLLKEKSDELIDAKAKAKEMSTYLFCICRNY
jgi:hypothetical protein